MENNKAIKKSQYGGHIGYGIFRQVLKLFGVRPAYFLLAFIIPYYVVFRASARRSASHYLKRRFPDDGAIARFFRTVKYMYVFGQTLIDQAAVAVLGERHLNYEFPEWENLFKHVRAGKGIILLSSHVGCWHMAMGSVGHYSSKIAFYFQLEEFNSGKYFFDISKRHDKFKIINPAGFLGGMVEMTQWLIDGNSAAIMGDRAFGAQTAKTEFMGAEAEFPVAPYYLAHSTNSDIFMLLPVRTGKMKFRLDAVKLNDGCDIEGLSKKEAIVELLRRYAENLEKCLRDNPYMWFNFFDFWDSGNNKKS